MKETGLYAAIFGAVMNFGLFFLKLYVSISSNSLSIYCDAVNNLFDVFSCVIVLIGFLIVAKLDSRRSMRTQSLITFVINIIIVVTGFYFLYNGLQRTIYPMPITYSYKYAALISVTVIVKIVMAVVYRAFNRRKNSEMLSALVLDSILDSCITAFTLLGLFVLRRVGFAIDGIFAIILGTIITATALKKLFYEAKYLINE